MGRGDLLGAVNKRGGFQKLSTILKFGAKESSKGKKESGHWKDWDNLKRTILPICAEFGRFPTRDELKDRKLSSIAHSIYNFGGIKAVSKKLGYKTTEDDIYMAGKGFRVL